MRTAYDAGRSSSRAVRCLVTPHDWKRWRRRYRYLPMVVACAGEALPAQWTAVWRTQKMSVLLETGKGGRYTVLGGAIDARLVGGADAAGLRRRAQSGGVEKPALRVAGRPLAVIRRWLADHAMPQVAGAPPFHGGLVGYLAYDVAESLEELRLPVRPPSRQPRYLLAEVAEGWVFDHRARRLFCFCLLAADDGMDVDAAFARARRRAHELRVRWTKWRREPAPPPPPEAPASLPADFFERPEMRLSPDRTGYLAAVRAAQERIAAGETYQVNLSVRQRRRLAAAPERVYEALRRLNPSPYMALLRFPEVTVVSGSPELLLSAGRGRLVTHPIAATRPRGPTARADRALARELAGDAKERAEHLMLVDLLRNDLGRVSRYGSVRVTDFMAVERYSHVMHLVSRIEGRLAPDRDLGDALAAVFPGGTITGAPKIRTMEIIGELEPERRGIYTGAIGWLGYNGTLKLNIAIRTLVAAAGVAEVQSGAGIVADSEPGREFEESLNKARALWLAVARAEAEPTARRPGGAGGRRGLRRTGPSAN